MPSGAEHERVDGEWSAVETMRHPVTPDELTSPAPVPTGPGWPPYAHGRTVLQCLQVVLNEEWAHHGFCVRDLGLLAP